MGKKKTLVAKKTLNPVFNEILRVSINSLCKKILNGNLCIEIAVSSWVISAQSHSLREKKEKNEYFLRMALCKMIQMNVSHDVMHSCAFPAGRY